MNEYHRYTIVIIPMAIHQLTNSLKRMRDICLQARFESSSTQNNEKFTYYKRKTGKEVETLRGIVISIVMLNPAERRTYMSEMKGSFKKHQPLRLLRNHTYPAYQLYALAGADKKTPPERVMTIAVLETLHWLGKRFRDFEIPDALKNPEAKDDQDVGWSDLQSFQINEGYKAEALWLPDEKLWAFQLTEPDLGPQPGEPLQTRPPVPGRIIETNIGYRLINGQVECGFRTMVSDVEGTTAPFEVYRLSVIKHLARHPAIGLRQGWPLLDREHVLNHSRDQEQLRDWLKSPQRMMPAVPITEA